MKQTLFGLCLAAFAVSGFAVMYQHIYIPDPRLPLVIAGSLFVLYLISLSWRFHHGYFKYMVLFSTSFFMVMALGAGVYRIWTFEAVFSAYGMMKITMILLGTTSVLTNSMYALSQLANKKRQVREIQMPANSRFLSFLFKKRKAEQHVAIVLGKDTKPRHD